MERGKGTRGPHLDGLQLRWGEAVVHLSRSGLRPQGCGSVWAGSLLPVPSLLRSRLRESARGQDVPGLEEGTEDKEAPRREREHDGAILGEAQGDAPKDLRAALVGVPRGRD